MACSITHFIITSKNKFISKFLVYELSKLNFFNLSFSIVLCQATRDLESVRLAILIIEGVLL